MNINVGGVDRGLRIVAGAVLMMLAATGTIGWWGWLGLIAAITGLVRFCPLYSLFGISSCKTRGR
ncbi:DUF2892 domain-containing protein [Pandoraea sp. XJJ-1]|uniref:YgaP family membrane protein n=1 Tax=unclassified Pandoraea TaxID=2624094 RepID=UPI000348D084|nr:MULTISPECIES: DUF2892 domain-containing protein [unclassified Pandoraea]MBN9116081.1 DUF2892 domain-containing protein [Pandoraea sp.]OJY22457.1 MAG: hypothetical protein BGP02_01355 [Pandoraea sp. 64-18]WAL82531.1 DUF2892 domain-containing protein [Pandoraea sp. XJJ-1]BDD92441.1 membrane protein [Pandoraea sp. NE5]